MDTAVERLVVRARDGDVGAFERLVERFQRRVFYTILRIVKDVHQADDLTQEVFLRAFRKLEHVQKESSFVSWLLRMAHNRAIDAHRRRRREGARVFLVDDWSELGSGGADPKTESETASCDDDGGERVETIREVFHETVAGLSQAQRDVLLLSMDGETSHEEIGRILQIPLGTVKSRLHHARKVITARLRPVLEGE